MLRLYDSRYSGNSWKIRILLNQLAIPFERITLDLEKGHTSDPQFVSKSRFSRVPVLELEDGRTIVESAAILLYLAEGTKYLPTDRLERAEVFTWMSFEQCDLQRALPLPRMYHLRGLADRMAQQIERLQVDGYHSLEKLERWLGQHAWLVGDGYTVADLAVFTYVSLAHQGGYDMGRFPAIARWLADVRNVPGWIDLFDVSAYSKSREWN
ncbi:MULTISPECIES: glutathione S-transferase family protein [unclassified Sinorhizobium]|uniref:glutathione S-transferase family protein n=1 Tax=unclassified Sinorhizobium TaxID=2613772 RepID=UPI0024C3B8E7|nr:MULTISPECIES: glutathione S-transferase family protein [unclassified Sinorhizobium]MDK1373770.1 glutathione S-transferase family protein [Sinorhizobium sp. 6-70]MDK1478729.1 glutathione S-transferase family protein [Sinorhizobium sp. 6-117]